MFFGDNVGHTIHRLTHKNSYSILYRPHGSCFDHFIRHLVSDLADKFFISNNIIVDDAINLIDGHNLTEVLTARLCVPYNFQMCSSVNRNIEATLTNHIPLIYLAHSKEDLIDIENNLLGRYPYIVLIANKALYDIAIQLDIDKTRLFYHPFSVQDNLENKTIKNNEPSVDVSIFLGGQDPNQVQTITNKLNTNNISTTIIPNYFSSQHLIEAFSKTRVVVELNPTNIYNTIYSINCGIPSIIYNKERIGNKDYIYSSFNEMVDKIKYLISNKLSLPKIGFADDSSTDIKTILENINNRGLII